MALWTLSSPVSSDPHEVTKHKISKYQELFCSTFFSNLFSKIIIIVKVYDRRFNFSGLFPDSRTGQCGCICLKNLLIIS